MNEEDLIIERCRRGDTRAFAWVVRKYQPAVFRIAMRLMCHTGEAEDMVQEAFVRAWCSIGSWRGDCSVGTWLYRIACNVCYDRLRQMASQAVCCTVDEGITRSAAYDVEADMTNRELCRLVMHYTRGLPPMQRMVFTLRDIEGLDSGEVCAITGLTAEQVKSNLYLARKFIKTKMGKERQI